MFKKTIATAATLLIALAGVTLSANAAAADQLPAQQPSTSAPQVTGTPASGAGEQAAVLTTGVGVIGELYPASSDANKPSYWEDFGPHKDAVCYKHEGNGGEHGSVTNDGKTVVLGEYGANWPGDHWELLIVKAGNWDAVTVHPEAGVEYAAFDNKAVSHWIVCKGTTPEGSEPVSVQTAPSATLATCEAAGTLVLPAQAGVIWSGGTNGAGPGSYDLVATAADGYTLTGQAEWTIVVPPMKSGVECAPPCIPNTAVSYTYDPATNSGIIHVENVDGSNGELCDPFWVTATSWKFIEGDKVWSQVRDVVQQLPKIDAPGDYPYTAPVDCGQGDIYASFTESPNPPKYLHGPSNPWAEHFLHQMGFTGPNPTYTQDSPGCNIVVPATPTATVIDECNELGSVQVPAESAAFTYAIVGGPTEGKVTVTATVKEGYVVQEGAQTVFEFDLGTYTPCKLIPGDPSSADQKCFGGELTPGSITVVPNVGKIVFVITGGSIEAPGITVPDDNPVTTLPAGNYTVMAHCINGNTVGPENSWTYDIVIGAPENCDPPTLALLNPTATQSNGSCTADPTYTLSNTTSANGGVQWWIGDPQVTTTPGTHKASWGSTVVVEATVVDPVNDGLETSPAVWTFTFPAKPACGDLLTLALTGSTGGLVIPLIASGLLLLGGAGIYFQRRLGTARAK